MATRKNPSKSKPGSDEWHFRLGAIRNNPDDPDAVKDLTRALESPSNFVVARAAQIIESRQEFTLLPNLVAAFHRMFEDPAKRDPSCAALTALVQTMHTFDCDDTGLFLRGVRHVQMEGSFGPPVDAAVELRAISAIALAQHTDPRVIGELTVLLADKEPGARMGAARALGCCGSPAAYPLLHFKTLTGDRELNVITECFSSMLALDPAQAIPVVERALEEHGSAHAEPAALALGPSRHPRAFEILKARYESLAGGSLKRTVLIAISLCRTEDALQYIEPLRDRLED
jgi:HEAT repeat protein